MTFQAQDVFIYNKKKISLCFKEDESQFDIDFKNKYQMEPCWLETACYKGYICHYLIDGDFLFLTDLFIHANVYNPINGVMPIGYKKTQSHTWDYEHYVFENNIFKYTGRLLLVSNCKDKELDGFIRDPYQYREFLELTFIEGELLETIDKSEEIISNHEYKKKILSTIEYEAKKRRCFGGKNNNYHQRFNALKKEIENKSSYTETHNWWDNIHLW